MAKRVDRLSVLAALLIYVLCAPYFCWSYLLNSNTKLIICGLLAIIFFIKLDFKSNNKRLLLILFAITLIATSFLQNQNIIGVFATSMLCVIPFAKEKFAFNTFEYFVSIYSIIISISAFVWLISFFVNVPSFGTIQPLNELKNYQYVVYPCLVKPTLVDISSRFFGVFDEPGVVGTLNALILVVYNFNLKDKRLLSVLITGFLSLSFFFYLIVIAYVVFNNVFLNNQFNKQIKTVTFLLLILAIVTYNIPIIYDTLWARFIWDTDSGTFMGDNRMTEVGYEFFNEFAKTKEFYFGASDYEIFEELVLGSSSYITLIVKHGIIICFLYLLVFALLGWSYKANIASYCFFIFVLLGTIYQRPFIFEPYFLFLFSMLAITCGKTV